jgi:hypothetical protein
MSNAPCGFNSRVKENLPANSCSAPDVRAVFECFRQFTKIIQLHLTLSLRGCFLILVRKAFALRPSHFSIGRELTKTFPPMSSVKVGGITHPDRARIHLPEETYLFCRARPLPNVGNPSKTSIRPARTTSTDQFGGKYRSNLPFLRAYAPTIRPILRRVQWKKG